jgi:DnaK suppressor protein
MIWQLMDSIVATLRDKRAELETELAQMSAMQGDTGGISFGKRVGEGTSIAVERLVQAATYEQLQAVLADVNRALAKFDEGSYGRCDRCGASIPSERLDILPWASLCVRCASER